MSPSPESPNPLAIFDAINSFQRTFALKTAIELDLFRTIAEGVTEPAGIAARVGASERGVRVLCDYLVVSGILTKNSGAYALTPDVALFLDSRSPGYIGTGAFFLAHPQHIAHFADLTAAVRKGGTARGAGNLDPNAAIWVEFARWMAPLSAMGAAVLAEMLATPPAPMKVLDVAAGHGEYGIAVARVNPHAQVVAQDWPNVLELARERATRASVLDRYRLMPGDAFTVELGTGYDLILVPNFLHHFDHATNVRLLRRLRQALAPGGRVAIVEFVPDDDRVSPATAAAFSLTMLASTEHGDAYTFRELDAMLKDAGFGDSRMQPLGPQTLIVSGGSTS